VVKITNISPEDFRTFNPEADEKQRRDLLIPGRGSVEVGNDFAKALTRDFPFLKSGPNVKLPPLPEDDDTEEAES